MLRRMIEDVTRDWVIRRRLPADFLRASIHVSPSAGLRYLYRSMEDIDSVLLSLVKEFVKPGAVVWDVGANVGLFSFAAASLAGPQGQIIAWNRTPGWYSFCVVVLVISRPVQHPYRSSPRQLHLRCPFAHCVLRPGPEPPTTLPSLERFRLAAHAKNNLLSH